MIEIARHSLLDVAWVVSRYPAGLGQIESPFTHERLVAGSAPIESSDHVRKSIRDMLRVDGYKPTGRGKPSSEYLIKARDAGRLETINVAVDICNIVSLHSGLPISVVDLDLLHPPLQIRSAGEGAEYVFNASGQVMSLGGLLCLFDHRGPCANGVKDSQRTKTSEQTCNTLSIIWGSRDLPGRTEQTGKWYCQMLEANSARVDQYHSFTSNQA